MKFVDEVRIKVKAGDGGNGAVAFRREKYVDKGGPSGGDGGNGGSVILKATEQLTTLLDFRYQQHYRAKNGQHGMGSDMNGKGSDDLVLECPVGTVVRDEATGEELVDLSVAGQTFVIAKGGRGGLGNINFATSTRQTPRFAQDGTPGEEKELIVELKAASQDGPWETNRFFKQLIEILEREEADVRRANRSLIEQALSVLDLIANTPGVAKTNEKQARELGGRAQALLESMGVPANAGSNTRAMELSHSAFAGSLRLAPADPLPWPFTTPEIQAPSAFTPFVLVPIEWRSADGQLVFGWRITE